MIKNVALFDQVKQLRYLSVEEAVSRLKKGLSDMGIDCSVEQENAWKGSWPHLKKIFENLPDDLWVGFEYRLPATQQRIDVIFLGKGQGRVYGCRIRNESGLKSGDSWGGSPFTAAVLEMKGWRDICSVGRGLVEADGERHLSPDIQAEDYVGKLRYTHSEAGNYELASVVWLYNAPPNDCLEVRGNTRLFFRGQYEEIVRHLKDLLTEGMPYDKAKTFVTGSYFQNIQLFQAIEDNFEALCQGAIEALSAKGFAPTDQQQVILEDVLGIVRENISGKYKRYITFLIQGSPGSGKSYLAIVLLLKALAEARKIGVNKNNVAVLGYRNNRLLNTIREVFRSKQPGLGAAINFFSTNKGFGLADNNPRMPIFQLAIFDEAQRLSPEHIDRAMQRGNVTVFLFDEGQRLNKDEGGTEKAFKDAARRTGRKVVEYTLRGVHRTQGGERYHQFVEHLISKGTPASLPTFSNYEFRVFADITEMIQELRKKKKKGDHVALVASFTESPGDTRNRRGRTDKNRRVGYPLCSGFDHYKRYKDVVDIYWLMDEKIQYPKFWREKQSNELTHCASIYGCQGFEADYVGVIWGRDFVWDPDNERWTLGSNCEDTIGKPSLKQLFNKGDEIEALPLLRNRYRIFLTRGIKGTYIYCEDEATACHLILLLRQAIRHPPLQEEGPA